MKKVGVFASVMFLSVSLFSCAPLVGPVGGENAIEIDVSDLPELTIPLSPAEAEAAYDDAKVFMDQKVMVPQDDAHPDLYYVMIFATNNLQMKNVLSYYIPYSIFPIPGFETNTNLLNYTLSIGVFTGEDYSNVMPFYALITSTHYNYFLSTNVFVFKPIKKMSYSELSNMGGFDDSFIAEYNIKMSYFGLTNSSKWYPWEPQFWENIWGNLSDAYAYIVEAPYPKVNCTFYVTYQYYDRILSQSIIHKFPPTTYLKLRKVGTDISKPAEIMDNGYARQYLNTHTSYDVMMDLVTPYAYNFYSLMCIGSIHTGDKDATYNINVQPNNNNPNYGFMYGIAYELYKFAENKNLNHDAVNINVKKPTTQWAAGETSYWGIDIDPEYQYYIDVWAHEYGHHIYHLGMGWLSYVVFGTGQDASPFITFPDGYSPQTYHNHNNSLKTEGWAEFFAVAFLINKYGKTAVDNNTLCKILEANYGSKELFFKSSTNGSLAVGYDTVNELYIYPYSFPRWYKEASILYDLWDKNEYNSYINSYDFIWASGSATAYMSWGITQLYFYANTEYTNAIYYALTYCKQAILNREFQNDTLSLPLSDIFDVLLHSLNNDKTLETCISEYFDSHLTGNKQAVMKILDMHSQQYPFYQAIKLALTNQVNPDGSVKLSWGNASILASYRIYRNSVKIATVSGTSYIDKTNLTINVNYNYSYSIVYNGVESAQSDSVSIILPEPIVPSNLVLKAISPTLLSVKWNSVSGALGYWVNRTDLSNSQTIVFFTPINQYDDSAIGKNKAYEYKVCTTNYAGKSAFGNTLTVMTASSNGPQIYVTYPAHNGGVLCDYFAGQTNVIVKGYVVPDPLTNITKVYLKLNSGVFQEIILSNATNFTYNIGIVHCGEESTLHYYCVDALNRTSITNLSVFKGDSLIFLYSFGGLGSGDGQLKNPMAMDMDQYGNIYVLDSGNCRIQKFSTNGTFISKFGTYGINPCQFYTNKLTSPYYPCDLTVTPNGKIVVVDTIDDTSFGKIIVFNTNGTSPTSWGNDNYGTAGVLDMHLAYSVTCDPDSYLYINRGYSNNGGLTQIKKFNTSGALSYQTPDLKGTGNGKILQGSQYAKIEWFYNLLYVVDPYDNQIEKFNASDGAYVGSFGSPGSGNWQFNNPKSVYVTDSHIFVVDSGNNRIQIKESTYFLKSFGTNGSANGQFNDPVDIIVSYPLIFVLDKGNARVQVFAISLWGE